MLKKTIFLNVGLFFNDPSMVLGMARQMLEPRQLRGCGGRGSESGTRPWSTHHHLGLFIPYCSAVITETNPCSLVPLFLHVLSPQFGSL